MSHFLLSVLFTLLRFFLPMVIDLLSVCCVFFRYFQTFKIVCFEYVLLLIKPTETSRGAVVTHRVKWCIDPGCCFLKRFGFYCSENSTRPCVEMTCLFGFSLKNICYLFWVFTSLLKACFNHFLLLHKYSFSVRQWTDSS